MDIKEAKIQDLEKELDNKKQQLKTDLNIFKEKIEKEINWRKELFTIGCALGLIIAMLIYLIFMVRSL